MLTISQLALKLRHNCITYGECRFINFQKANWKVKASAYLVKLVMSHSIYHAHIIVGTVNTPITSQS